MCCSLSDSFHLASSSRPIHIVANGKIFSFLILWLTGISNNVYVYIYIYIYMHTAFFIHSSVAAHLGCLHVLLL